MLRLLQFLVVLTLFSSCKVLAPQVMFKTEKDISNSDTNSITRNKEYLLSPYDRLEMNLYSIEGYKLVDVTATAGSGQTGGIFYVIEEDGKVKLPILGKVPLVGMTVRDGERKLEELYSKYYIDPFILLKVTNRQVYVFFADGGRGSIINIPNDRMNVIEVMAAAGGLTENSKASRIKVIRGDPHNPEIHIIDMSTMNGIKSADLSVQSHDIIYVESLPRYSSKVLTQITPIIGILTSVLLIANLFKK
jgi:polysaccharide export outer membrane protein